MQKGKKFRGHLPVRIAWRPRSCVWLLVREANGRRRGSSRGGGGGGLKSACSGGEVCRREESSVQRLRGLSCHPGNPGFKCRLSAFKERIGWFGLFPGCQLGSQAGETDKISFNLWKIKNTADSNNNLFVG